MKAQELRIGNYISEIGVDIDYNGNRINDGTFEVVKVDIDILKDILSCWEYYYTEIPLKEEWLIKLGGVKATDSFGGYLFYYPNGNGMRIKNNEWSSQHITVKVEFVHQLQNLYFALTGEELC